jgi:hypothetical protein
MEDPNTYEGRQSTSTTDDPSFNSFPQNIKNIITKLRITVDHIDSPRNYARDLIHELARELDERRLCDRNQISRRIKKILEDKIQDGKITKEWISECLPEDYKRKYIKCKLSLLSKPHEDKDTEQDPAESAVVQEPWLKRELLAQADTSGHSIQQQQPSEPGQLETDTTQQPGGNDIISFKPPQRQGITKAQHEANPVKTHDIGDNGDNTDKSSRVSSLQYVKWRECSFSFDDVWNVVYQAQSKDLDKFWFCVKLDRPATIVDIRLGRLDRGEISHD